MDRPTCGDDSCYREAKAQICAAVRLLGIEESIDRITGHDCWRASRILDAFNNDLDAVWDLMDNVHTGYGDKR